MKAENYKITVTIPTSIYPPLYGGQLRTFHLYRYLAQWFDIEAIAYTHYAQNSSVEQISEGFWEICVPKSKQHAIKELEFCNVNGLSVGYMTLLRYCDFTKEYLDILWQSAQTSDFIVASPYTFRAVRKVTDKPIWYDAHNVEYDLMRSIHSNNTLAIPILEELKELEKECCRQSEIIMTCSQKDADRMIELYDLNPEKFLVVPNGVDISSISCKIPSERKSIKEKYIQKDKFNAVFIGSKHPPNVIAVQKILEISRYLSNVQFIIIGNVGDEFINCDIPNVDILGVVDEDKKNEILGCADVALNPMPYGSGTHLKMVEYFAMGLPVITTPIGARGLLVENQKHVIICDIDHFDKAIIDFMNYEEDKKDILAKNARLHAEQEFDWALIAQNTIQNLIEKIDDFGILKKKRTTTNYLKDISRIKEQSAQLLSAKQKEREILIWGAGKAGRDTLKLLKKENINVTGFIDKDYKKWGSTIDGIIVYPYTTIENHLLGNKPSFVVIASLYAKEITDELQKLGYKKNDDFVEQYIKSPFLYLR